MEEATLQPAPCNLAAAILSPMLPARAIGWPGAAYFQPVNKRQLRSSIERADAAIEQ